VSYADFLAAKKRRVNTLGRPVALNEINGDLFNWQQAIVQWAVQRGRAAIFADCGLGKTFMQLEWARLSAERSLILAPLSVARQTAREAVKLGTTATYVRDPDDVTEPGIYVSNYEMAHHFDPAAFGAVVLDESSILKNVDGPTRRRLTEQFAGVPARLACTATPAPNDVAELCNHAEFLGILPRAEMLSAYFVHDEDGWRVKGHASEPMHEWIAQWATALRRPSDLGWEDDGYQLPDLRIHPEVIDVDIEADGQLFATELGGVGGRSNVRRKTLDERCDRAIELASDPDEQWVVWCGLNDEADKVARAVPGAVNVQGSTAPDEKAEALEAFQDGSIRVLVTKPQIAGFGMNFQQCHKMAFVGLNDSYEAYYQAVRRCWRFGQQHPVDVHVVVSSLERQIVENVRRKENEASSTTEALIRHSQVRRADDRHGDSAVRDGRSSGGVMATAAR